MGLDNESTGGQDQFPDNIDEGRGVGEDPRYTRGYMSQWEGHFPMHLTILGVLKDDELQPTVDHEVVGGEDDVPSDRVLAGAWRGAGRQHRGFRVIWRIEPEVGQEETLGVEEAAKGGDGGVEEAVVMDILEAQIQGARSEAKGGVSQADFDRLQQQRDATQERLHSLKDELQIDRARRQSLEAKVKWLLREVLDLIESLQTTRTKVDDLRMDKEDSEWLLEEAWSGIALGALQDSLH